MSSVKIKRFQDYIKESYNMGRQDLIKIMVDNSSFDEETLQVMSDSELDELYVSLGIDRDNETIPSGTGGFFPKTKPSGINYTGANDEKGIIYTGS